MTPIRVVHLVASFDVGGLQKGVVNVINRSDPEEFKHLVVSLSPDIEMAERLSAGDVVSLGVQAGERAAVAPEVAERLKSFGAQVLHTRNWPTLPDGWRARRRAGVKGHVHGYHGRNANDSHGYGWKRRVVGRYLMRSVNRVITLTEAMSREFTRDFGSPRGGFSLIPNGVAIPAEPAPPWDQQPTGFRVLAVGRLDPVKNYPSLVKAFAHMPGRQPNDRLCIVGGGSEKDLLEKTASDAGVLEAVELPGLLDDPSKAYQSAHAFVQSSIYEGMSNTLVEAMSFGLPVVATDVGGNSDVVQDAGILYPSGDVQTLAQHLGRLRSDSAVAGALGAAARARVEAVFSYEQMLSQYESVYREVSK